MATKPRVRNWEPTGWAARKEPLRSGCVQRHYTLLTEAGGDWRNPLSQADGSSLVLRMRVADECNAIPFSGQLVAWAAALGFNVVDNSRGGRQIGGTECGIIAWRWPKLVTIGARFLLHRRVLQHPSHSSNGRLIGRRSGQLRASVTTRWSDTLRSRKSAALFL